MIQDHLILVETLKKTLKLKGVSYKTLAQKWKLSESSVKRIMSQGDLNLERISEACELMQMSFADLVKLSPFETENLDPVLKLEQEQIFAKEPRMFGLFSLLLDGKTIKQIEKKYDITYAEMQKYLNQMERMGLLQSLPNHRVRMLVKEVRLRRDGPLGTVVLELAKSSFLNSKFREPSEHIRFGTFRLDAQSASRYKAKLDKIMFDIKTESELETNNPGAMEFGLLLAFRPWESPLRRILPERKKSR